MNALQVNRGEVDGHHGSSVLVFHTESAPSPVVPGCSVGEGGGPSGLLHQEVLQDSQTQQVQGEHGRGSAKLKGSRSVGVVNMETRGGFNMAAIAEVDEAKVG